MSESSLSTETLTFLSELLKQVTVSAADPGFEKAAEAVIRARHELTAALATRDTKTETAPNG